MTDPTDIATLARNAGLDLPDEYMTELASAWQHVAPIIARIRRDRPYGDEPAHVFVPTTFDERS